MGRFGVFKLVSIEDYRSLRPWSEWVPQRLIRRMPPYHLGDVWIGRDRPEESRGMLWIASNEGGLRRRWPRMFESLEVVGVEGVAADRIPSSDTRLLTNGDALELLAFMDGMASAASAGTPLIKQRIAVGGSDPAGVSTTARLLGRMVGEMVLLGKDPYLRRVAGHILAETGLAVRVCSMLPEGRFDRIVWCGDPPGPGMPYHGLFQRRRRLKAFPWPLHSESAAAAREMASFAAAEAWLLSVEDLRANRSIGPTLSVRKVERIADLRRQMGFHPKMEALDTPPPVGYNDNNF